MKDGTMPRRYKIAMLALWFLFILVLSVANGQSYALALDNAAKSTAVIAAINEVIQGIIERENEIVAWLYEDTDQ